MTCGHSSKMATCTQNSARLAGNPSRPTGQRDRWLADLRRRFRPIRGRVRHFAGYGEDGFGLRSDNATLSAELALAESDPELAAYLADGTPENWPDPPDEVYRFDTSEAKAEAFVTWFRKQIRERVLAPMAPGRVATLERAEGTAVPNAIQGWDHWTAEYLRGAYRVAWRVAGSRLRTAGVRVGDTTIPDGQAVDAAFNVGVRPTTLRRAYARTYRNLQSVVDDAAADQLRETITKGIAAGINPRQMATELTRNIRSLQKRRAETLARTETAAIRADSTLDRYEAAGVETVRHGEWSDAGDAKVCPICSRLDGREIPLSEMRTGTFRFEPGPDDPDHLAGLYALKPPAHPNCRCVILPVVPGVAA